MPYNIFSKSNLNSFSNRLFFANEEKRSLNDKRTALAVMTYQARRFALRTEQFIFTERSAGGTAGYPQPRMMRFSANVGKSAAYK